jgi:hypothetical protein
MNRAIAALIVSSLALGVYLNSLHGEFLFDDLVAVRFLRILSPPGCMIVMFTMIQRKT